jgi:hypothetical protein
MGGVDLKDQLLQMYLVERKHLHKWYLKLCRRFLNATVLNTMIIYRHNTGHKIDHLAFRVNLVEARFKQFANTEHKVTGHRAPESTIPRLLERHFINKVPPTGKKHYHREGAWCVPNTAERKTHDIAAYSVTSACVLRIVLKPIHKTSFLR